MFKKNDFNGLIEFKVYDGDRLYKLGFKANLAEEPYHRGAINRLIYVPVQTVLNPESTSEGWEEMFDANYDGDELCIGIKKTIMWMLSSYDPKYQKADEPGKYYRRLSFEGHTETYHGSYGV